MLRDTRRDADYFKRYIVDQNTRIDKFEGVLQKIVKEGGNDAKESQCHMYLSNFYQDLLFAEYSYGIDTAQLKNIYMHYLTHVRKQSSLAYDTALMVFSWAILLNIKNSPALSELQYPQDGLLEAFSQYLKGDCSLQGLSEIPTFSPVSAQFLLCLNGKVSPEDFRDYIANSWYESNRDSAWYNSDNRDDDTYCGYWCVAGAAVIKMMQWNPCLFTNTPYCPVELLF